MSLNRILAYEQLTLMRYALESDIDMAIIHRHKLSLIAQLLTSYPYPHRPYSRRSFNPGESTPILPATSRALLAWENEGGALRPRAISKSIVGG
jgi:hypothetical protein